jgi:hypothetical protein
VEDAAGAPVAGVRVVVFGREEPGVFSDRPLGESVLPGWPLAETISDHDGRFTIKAVPDLPGLRIMALSEGGWSQRAPVAEADDRGIRLRLANPRPPYAVDRVGSPRAAHSSTPPSPAVNRVNVRWLAGSHSGLSPQGCGENCLNTKPTENPPARPTGKYVARDSRRSAGRG